MFRFQFRQTDSSVLTGQQTRVSMLIDWVEKGAAPSRIDASARPGTMYFPGRTRPLCAYPSYARYDGSGSLEDAANFVCSVN